MGRKGLLFFFLNLFLFLFPLASSPFYIGLIVGPLALACSPASLLRFSS